MYVSTLQNPYSDGHWKYSVLKEVITAHNVSLPAMFVNLQCFDANAHAIANVAIKSNKTIRIATKVSYHSMVFTFSLFISCDTYYAYFADV